MIFPDPPETLTQPHISRPTSPWLTAMVMIMVMIVSSAIVGFFTEAACTWP